MTDTTQKPGKEEAPLKFELMQADDYGKYLLHARAEILYILRALQQKGSLITVYFNRGADFLLTSILAMDDNRIVVDIGADARMNCKALASDKLIFITTHDKVKIQFSVPHIEETQFDGRPALHCAVPDMLLRLQRREYFRLTTPVARPLKCTVPMQLENGTKRAIEANVIDISGGGVAVVAPPEGVPFAPEMRFENCRIDLPDIGAITATLQVRNLFDITLRTGTHIRRAGCQFMNLPGAMESMIQRYITKLERERKARESGLG